MVVIEVVMNIGQIRYFVAAFEEGSFSAAARKQFVTVQAVSKAVSDLEGELGKSLFIRGNRSARPTEFGTAFYDRAVVALEKFAALESFPGDYERMRSARPLKMALCSPVFPHIDRALQAFSLMLSRIFGVRVEMERADVREGVKGILDGSIDLAVSIGVLEHAGIDCTPIGMLPTGVVVAPCHPLAERSCATIAELNDYTVLFSKEYDDFNESVLSLYRKEGLVSPVLRVEHSEDCDAFKRAFFNGEVYVFGAAVSSMYKDVGDARMVPVCSTDMRPISICILSRADRHEELRDILEKLQGSTADLIRSFGA